MAQRINLLGAAYEARSVIADAQKCVNLFAERNPQDAAAPMTHYPRAGLRLQLIPTGVTAAGRCLYTATNGRLYYICGTKVIYIDSNFVQTTLGTLNLDASTPAKMVDNGNAVVIVDGSTDGYAIDLETNAFAEINDPAFLGGTNVDYLDTFLVLNQPETRNFYSSLSNVTFDDLTNYGVILTAIIANPGSSYSNGTYLAQALTGGSGSGATANIIVSGGAVTSITIVSGGTLYDINDSLSAAIPSGSGLVFTVAVVQQAFDPTYVAAKTGFPDEISTLNVVHREIWLYGKVKTSEVWYDAGGASFPFAIIPGVFIEHGCVAKYSPAKHDLLTFWLSIDQEGQGTIYEGVGYQAKKISTPAIAYEISQYDDITDAVGMMFKQADHVFYMLSFPGANKTWVYDLSEDLWSQWGWTDTNSGALERHRAHCMALAYGLNLCADWENGNVYQIDQNYGSDFGGPISRIRSMPHLNNALSRFSVGKVIADMECGNGIPSDLSEQPLLTLEVSRDRGRTYLPCPLQSLGLEGEFLVLPTWHQIGLARDMVFLLTWSSDVITALNGLCIDVTPTVEPGT